MAALAAARRIKEQIMARDPVCGMEIDPRQAAGQTEYEGQTYYFCAPACQREFEQHPERYVGARR